MLDASISRLGWTADLVDWNQFRRHLGRRREEGDRAPSLAQAVPDFGHDIRYRGPALPRATRWHRVELRLLDLRRGRGAKCPQIQADRSRRLGGGSGRICHWPTTRQQVRSWRRRSWRRPHAFRPLRHAVVNGGSAERQRGAEAPGGCARPAG
jgi:hypothetical protein